MSSPDVSYCSSPLFYQLCVVIMRRIYNVWSISNNAIYQPMNAPLRLYFLISCLYLVRGQVQPYSYLGSTSSATHTLYNNSAPMSQGAPPNSYSIPYSTPKPTNPELVINLVGLEQRDDLTDAYLKITLTANTLSSFSVDVLCGGSSLMYLVKIMYLSIEDTYAAFYCLWVQYPSFTVVNTGTGNRLENKYSSFYSLTGGGMLNNNLTLNRVYPCILGFQIQTPTGNYALQLTAVITNSISFTTTVKTESDCRVQFLQGMFLFIDTSKFLNRTLYYYDTTLIVDTLNSVDTRFFTPNHFASPGHRILGLSQFKGTGTRSSGAFVKFDCTLEASQVRIIKNSTTRNVQYTYLFLGLDGCQSSYPYFSDSTRSYCVSQCLSSQTQSPPSQICLACSSPCSQCSLQPTNCSRCESGYSLVGNKCEVAVVVQVEGTKLYLLGLLGIIPIAILVVYLCLRKRSYVLNRKQVMAQPTIDFS